MASEAPAPILSVRERMATLNLNQVGKTPSDPPPAYDQVVRKARPPPPPVPKRRPDHQRADSTNNPPTLSNGIASQHTIGNQPAKGGLTELLPPPTTAVSRNSQDGGPGRPALPTRRPTAEVTSPPPNLPPRRPSVPSRKQSTESISSVVSGRSSVSGISTRTSISAVSNGNQPKESKFRIRAPEYDPATLPSLPERKAKNDGNTERPRLPSRSQTLNQDAAEPNRRPSLNPPPSLPTRPNLPTRPEARTNGLPKRSALDFGMNKSTETPPPLPTNRPSSTGPPPVPRGSRPDLASLQATKPKPSTNATTNGTASAAAAGGCCLVCRDFSGPDNHAARYPRQSIPSQDTSWLGRELTAPFTSDTDKARAIFTWLHHNIAYDTVSFFAKNIKPSTPGSTIASGLAVCEGYAGLFSALALAAGLECVVVCGNGKGYGYDPANPPSKPDGHAWNAVRIDNGHWKLIDPCWGAGAIGCEKVDPSRSYVKRFDPSFFTMSNDRFGERHYPEDDRYFFRDDGRPRISFQEYLAMDAGGQNVQCCPDTTAGEGIDEATMQPRAMAIKLNDPLAPGPTLRIQCQKLCQHWDAEKHGKGKPYLLIVKINGPRGDKEEWIPVNHDGYNWWVDVPRDKMGLPGQDVRLCAVTCWGTGQDGRGLTIEEYRRTRPTWRKWGWSSVATWVLV